MQQAASVVVNIDDFNLATGKIIAQITHVEAGFLCSGASGGLVLHGVAAIASEQLLVTFHGKSDTGRIPDGVGSDMGLVRHRAWHAAIDGAGAVQARYPQSLVG